MRGRYLLLLRKVIWPVAALASVDTEWMITPGSPTMRPPVWAANCSKVLWAI